jgi:hypothetical protein
MFAFSTAYFAYFASLTFIAVKPIYPLIERIFQFKDFLVSQFVLGTVGESLDAISLRHYYHAHGGVLPIYLYYYLGWLGVSISGIVVGLYLRFMSLTKHKKSELKNIVAIYITSTVPRWYLYSPNQLIRGVMIMSLMYLAYSFIYSITQKRKVLMILNSK